MKEMSLSVTTTFKHFLQRLSLDVVAAKSFGFLAVVAVCLLIFIIAFLLIQSFPVFKHQFGLQFLNSDGWYPLDERWGLLPMVWATLAVGVGALFLAVPFGVGCAIFSCYLAPLWLGHVTNSILNLLAGIPSVVFGLWGLSILVPLINEWHAPGASLLAAIVIVGLMILPTIAITARAALIGLPPSYHQAAACLSLSSTSLIISILLPAASRGILAGMLLALARAFGETMAVVMVAGNVVQIPQSIFDPVRVLTANIALEMAYATEEHRAALFASGVLLLLLVAITLIVANKMQNNILRNGHELG